MQPERLLAIAASLIIISAIIAGLFLIESPLTARAARFDQERINNLNTIARYVDEHYRVNGSMPADLSAINQEFNFERFSTDPRDDASYRYERIETNAYRLCATFETDGPHEFTGYSRPMLAWDNHEREIEPSAVEGAGEHCFEITILEKP